MENNKEITLWPKRFPMYSIGLVNECGVLDDWMSEGSEGLDINVARKSRQVGESQLDTFPQQREIAASAEERAAPSHRPSVKHVEATTETHVDVDNYSFHKKSFTCL